ncbi:RNA polymerase-binding transcription factor DksA [Streptomyces alboniger]
MRPARAAVAAPGSPERFPAVTLDITRTHSPAHPGSASPTGPRSGRLTAHDARQRLEHARSSRAAQLRALDESGQSAADQLMSEQVEAIGRVLKEIDEAFARIDDGTYGICLGCSEPVPAERLEILPYTRYCVTCQRRVR